MLITTTFKDAFTSTSSDTGKLNWADIARVARIIVVAMVGAGLTEAVKLITGADFGQYNVVAQIVATGLTELARRLAFSDK
jgi:hypothetical protein